MRKMIRNYCNRLLEEKTYVLAEISYLSSLGDCKTLRYRMLIVQRDVINLKIAVAHVLLNI